MKFVRKLGTTRGMGKSVVAVGGREMAKIGTAGTLVAATLLLTGCSNSASTASSATTPKASDASLSTQVVHEQMVIETGKMDGKPGWPKFTPSNLSIPAGKTIELQIVNHDDGTAPLAPDSPYGHVWGSDPTYGKVIGGTETVDGKPVTQIANDQVSHTLTIPGLLINIPIPAVPSGQTTITVDYTFEVSKTGIGKYLWQCEAPCGTGATGNGGAMSKTGYMEGYITVT